MRKFAFIFYTIVTMEALVVATMKSSSLHRTGSNHHHRHHHQYSNDTLIDCEQQINKRDCEISMKWLHYRKQRIQENLGQICMWCFAYSTKKTLDCLRRHLIGRIQFLRHHMCLVG